MMKHLCYALLALLFLPLAYAQGSGGTGGAPADAGGVEGLVVMRSAHPFDETRSRLEAALRENDLTIIDRIDHSRNASQAGLGLLPTLLIVFGNPAAGTPLMQAERTVAIDLPQKMLVYQDNDGVFVAYNDPMYLAERHHLTGVDAILENVADTLQSVATAATAP